ncbi:putative metallo-hydrolase YycJ [Novipirellula galeiformis]|uniref:Putative metallo-hydrolase YycJ n=1 Tax=Novipirellula galeiformis TaxID=2528004 RepID=A0A5C6CAF0_9BACT|nr:MBL fold metallo-hydrolase [Novipirellula galeiformis]TWU21055.1 putative metallo-hydrolase YycJ [Novipirellula galeiformis]
MEVITLQSGSNGNCVYVEADGVRLLFDAGISGVQAETRLAAHGRDIRDVDALIISHDHSDHTRCMGVYQRKFGLPIHVSAETLRATAKKSGLGRVDDVHHFRAGSTLAFGNVRVETHCTPHDACESVAFVVDDGTNRFGILTDIGHVDCDLEHVVGTLDAMILESNYDPAMLHDGPYPEHLKDRIRGSLGHLSNEECADLINRKAGSRLKWACLGHLSQHNNRPELVLQTHRQMLDRDLDLHVADRFAVGAVRRVGASQAEPALRRSKPR